MNFYFRSPQAHDVRALEPHGEAVRAYLQDIRQ